MPRRRPDKEKVKVTKARVKSAPKPYLRVPEEFLTSNDGEAGEHNGEELPRAENLFRKHLFNQSAVNAW